MQSISLKKKLPLNTIHGCESIAYIIAGYFAGAQMKT
jgi:hypothetical protein